MKEYYSAIHEIIKTGHWITDSISRELKEYNIYEPQYNVLRVLNQSKGRPISVNTILENMVQRSSNVTRIVDKLAAKGLVERTLALDDRRKMDISITQKGSKLLKVLDRKVQAFHQPMQHNLTEKESKTLKNLIQKLRTR